MARKIFVIWNPFAGGKSERIIKKLTTRLDTETLAYSIFDTQQTKNATLSIRQHLDTSFTDLIIVGGDGTINESVNGLNHDIPVSIIPAGTGDDFIKNITLGKNINAQIETAINGRVISIDLGQCNERKFVNGVGIGFDGQIVEDMASKRVPVLSGHAAYYYHVLRILGGYQERSFTYHVDDKAHKKDLILLTVGNGTTFGGGFKLMPQASIDDGLLDICEIGRISSINRFLNIHKLSNGTHGTLKEVSLYKAKEVTIAKNDLLYAHIDGEQMGQPPFTVKVLPNALKIRISS